MKAPKTNTDELATGKRSCYWFALSMLQPDPENVRADYGDVDAMARALAAGAKFPPLTVRRLNPKANVYVVTDGHRRLMAASIAKEKYGADLSEGLPCMLENKGTTEAERLLLMIGSGTHGKPLTPVEEGLAYRKALEKFGVKLSDLAARTGRTVPYIKGCLEIAANPEAAHLKPSAAAKLSSLSKSAAASVLASGVRTGRQVDDAARGRARIAGRRAIQRELAKQPAKEPVNDYQRGVLAGLEFALGKQEKLAWGEA